MASFASRFVGAFLFFGGLAAPLAAYGQQEQDKAAPKVTETVERTHAPDASEFLVLPLRVYRLKSEEVDAVHCRQLADDDIRRIVARANVIWASAGIHWQLEGIEDLPAENVDRLKLATRIGQDADDKASEPAAVKNRLPHTAFRRIVPAATRSRPDVFRVHYVHDFDVNGVYFGNREAMVKETAALRPVEGGIEEPLPRVTSHELGHALGLPHRQDRLNLMASGTTGTFLSDAEMAKAREIATKNPACLTFEKLEKEAAETKDAGRKAMLERSLRSIKTLATKRIHPVGSFDVSTLTKIDESPAARP